MDNADPHKPIALVNQFAHQDSFYAQTWLVSIPAIIQVHHLIHLHVTGEVMLYVNKMLHSNALINHV